MRFATKLAVSMLLASAAFSASALTDEENAAPGFFTCNVNNTAGDTLYMTTAAFPGKRGDAKVLAQAFADKVLKDFPEAGSLDLPLCNFGFEAKYADMYLDQIKGQFSGDTQAVDFKG